MERFHCIYRRLEACTVREIKKCVLSNMVSDASDLSTFQGHICLRHPCFEVIKLISHFNLSKTKRILLYLKTQCVPRCKHFSSRL